MSVGAIAPMAISFVVWMRRGRQDDGPDSWLAAILPVALPPEEILPFQRPEDSGSQTAMLALVMKDRPIAAPMQEEVATGMGSIIQQVAEYRDLSGALGYSFRWYATVINSNPNIRLLAVDGVEPTVQNIRNGSYPLTANLNIVTTDSSNPNVPALLNWIVGAEGQALIEKAGYVAR